MHFGSRTVFFTVLGDFAALSRDVFFHFLRTASHETPTYFNVFGSGLVENGLETYDSVAEVPEKVKKTSNDSFTPWWPWASGRLLGKLWGRLWWFGS